MGRGLILGDQPRLHPKRRGPSAPQFWGFSCLISTPFNARRPNTYGEGRVLGGQPRHCICTNAWRGLSAIVELLVEIIAKYLIYFLRTRCSVTFDDALSSSKIAFSLLCCCRQTVARCSLTNELAPQTLE